ncbi:carbohydrate kinase family protein [Ornithinibacillus scapharcae]|uniref:carbohydrate kinase family protein n=1 Tax=Ornithinibacillus scapharcae TaxID=1147159 RepID=UPI000225BB86|nr:carbohydrate kinase [Ornithinibacillus scapharcae]
MLDVIGLGEILIDFTPQQLEQGNPSYVANPGGAPGNVMVALSCLGERTGMIASVGQDQFGEMLKETLKGKGVNIEGIVQVDTPTTLAFVHIGNNGERSFSFYRKPGADMMLKKDDVPLELIKGSKVFHIGSISLTDEPVREATLAAVSYAKDNGVLISYDPNLRPALWSSLDEAKKWIEEILPIADIVKLSEEELEFLTDIKDIKDAANRLLLAYNIPLLLITCGTNGSYVFSGEKNVYVPGFTVNAIDTTGCGDAFFAGVLHMLLEKKLVGKPVLTKDLREILLTGNAMGAIVATKRGAIPAMPDKKELEKFLQSHT